MYIGKIKIQKGAAFAPMAGVSDLTMRKLCARYGAAFTVSEMVSAKAITMQDRKTKLMYRGGGGNAPYGVQLFGHEPDIMYEAVQQLQEETFDFLDLNMGCPAPKIVTPGNGSALLKNPPLAQEIALAAVKASNRPVTAKIRLGWDEKQFTGLEVAKRLEAAGVAMLTIHGRTREQMYIPGVNYEAVAQIKAAVSIPVLYNGDVVDGASALHALRQTGCDGVMIGRGAMGAPWVFKEVAAAINGGPMPAPPTLYERMRVLDEQVAGMCAEKGEAAAMRQARAVAAQYMRGLRGAATLRRQAFELEVYPDLALLIENVYEMQQRPEADESLAANE